MKRLLIMLMLIWGTVVSAAAQTEKPVQQPAYILKNYDNFFQYVTRHMKLSQDIVTSNAAGKAISKGDFLKVLTTGYYLPVRLQSADPTWHFTLYKLSAAQAKEMGQYLSGWAGVLYDNYQRERKPFPVYDFTDINGKHYTPANLKGKTLVLNCWFIGCATCEKEMPALNNLVAKYKSRANVVFVSLAPDSKAKLQAFLKRKPFHYAVVADQKSFIKTKLNVDAFPSHFIVNKRGIIVGVVDTPEEVQYVLDKRI